MEIFCSIIKVCSVTFDLMHPCWVKGSFQSKAKTKSYWPQKFEQYI